MFVGYVRTSTTDQNTARQLQGVEVERTFVDQVSGKNTDRPALQELVAFVREGDTVMVHSMDRLARNLQDLMTLVERLTAKGVRVQFQKEGMTFCGDDTPMAKFMMQMMGAVAEFERSLILERQREGIAMAKAEGRYRGRAASLKPEQVAELRKLHAAGVPVAKLARDFEVSRQSVYNYLKG